MSNEIIKKISINNFTTFDNEELVFGNKLNVIIGENGAGKTHLLKLIYALTQHSYISRRDDITGKLQHQVHLANRLVGIFRPDSLGKLVRKGKGQRCSVALEFSKNASGIEISFASNSKSEVIITNVPEYFIKEAPVFIPTKELLSIHSGFVSLYQSKHLEFDETWYDTCLLLGEPALRGSKEEHLKKLLDPIEETMGGEIVLEKSGRFYFRTKGLGKIEMHLLAEGLRKLSMIARLISTGRLLNQGFLFWDEPESNLNPKLIRSAAKITYDLAKSGVQVFVATHSLFYLKELEILIAEDQENDSIQEKEMQYIGLSQSDGNNILQTSSSLSGLSNIVALDESLLQSDRFLKVV